jgi:hypothetical protein
VRRLRRHPAHPRHRARRRPVVHRLRERPRRLRLRTLRPGGATLPARGLRQLRLGPAAGSAPRRRHRQHPARTRPVLRRGPGHASPLGRADLGRHTARPTDPAGAGHRRSAAHPRRTEHAIPWRSVAHVRDLLMHSGVLPHCDRHLLLFQRWLGEWMDHIEEPHHRQLLHQFATWHLLRRLRATAATRPSGRGRSRLPAPRVPRQPLSWPGSPRGTAPSASAPKPTSTPGMPTTPPAAASPTRSCAGARTPEPCPP